MRWHSPISVLLAKCMNENMHPTWNSTKNMYRAANPPTPSSVPCVTKVSMAYRFMSGNSVSISAEHIMHSATAARYL